MQKNSKKAGILVSLHDDIEEIRLLAESTDYYIVKTFVQHRDHPDVTSYIGIGKRDEIKEYITTSEEEISVVIIDGTLKPSQWFVLENYWKVPVYDRLRLILMIFKDRADRKEARLQVRLAELQYERPFVRELIHRARSGEHPGLMAGGEYQVDDYYEMMKKQMKQIKEKLDHIRKQRHLRRRHRHHSGYFLVSLAGYTNAGKSSLLNVLTDEKIDVEDRLFSTLSTTTRKLDQSHIPILMTDTVGFIQRLPAWIIDAFHSTLEEIKDADVVILVVDASDPFSVFQRKVKTSMDELSDLGVTNPILVVLNKTDLISNEQVYAKEQFVNAFCAGKTFDIVSISVHQNRYLAELLKKLYSLLPQLYQIEIQLPNTAETQSFLSWVYGYSQLDDIVYSDKVSMIITTHQQIKDKIISKVISLKGNVIDMKQL
ncbi:MAG TPA: GTPase HflX [Candidatus Thermoplasmatota archaeon]|nr:GTPase HflX [Candidatus Thermoplasmatota archaeon]